MKPLGIRNRILFAALAPAALVAFLVSSLLVAGQIEQARTDQHRRLSAVARQIASAAEYNIFVGNSAGLLALLETTSIEPDVVGAAILDLNGKVLASTVPIPDLPKQEEVQVGLRPHTFLEHSRHWHSIVIRSNYFGEQDLFSSATAPSERILGQLLLRVSGEPLRQEMLRGVLIAAGLSILVLLFGILLALALSRDLIGLLLRISQVVDQVGHGIGGARIERSGPDELGRLAEGIDRMIGRVEINQAELAARIGGATLALRREKEEAEAAALSRSRFFAAASHDLRQPVQALGLFVAQLEREAHGRALLSRVRQLAQTVRNLQDLLDTLLDYSRLDGQVFRTDIRPVSTAAVIEAVASGFAAAAVDKRLQLRVHACERWVLTDPGLLHRILLNLVSNAIRHTRRGGILIGCRVGTTHARISVWDTGPGIPQDQQAAIFDELVQLENPERDANKGLGLGLAIVRRTADLLHHPLQLRSRLGRGSCFSILVPLTDAPAPPPALPAEHAPEANYILVIGPLSPEHDELVVTLGDWGLLATTASDVGQAIRLIDEHGRPALLIWDTVGKLDATLAALDWVDTVTNGPLPTLLIHPGPISGLETRSEQRLLLSRPFRPARLRALLNHLARPGMAGE